MAEDIRWALEAIRNREILLPEFQREYTWNRDQAKTLIDSLRVGYPTGAFLLWKTKDVPALKNMPDFHADHRVSVLLDGQQRLTTLYLLTRDSIPPYYRDQDIKTDPRNLFFNLLTRELLYYKPSAMDSRPEWVQVTQCFSSTDIGLQEIAEGIADRDMIDKFDAYVTLDESLKALTRILDTILPIMYVKEDSILKDALTVFDRVNSQGTPLTEADLALAHMCSHWAEARRTLKAKQAELEKEGFAFNLTFFIRAMNAVINCRAEYAQLHGTSEHDLVKGWTHLDRILDYLVNFLRGSALIYSSNDLNTANVLIPIIGYLAKNDGIIRDDATKRKLLYWLYAALMQQRFSSQVDQNLEIDLHAISEVNSADVLINDLEEDSGKLDITADSLSGRTVNHPLYSMMGIVIRAAGGVDWINNLDLSQPFGPNYSPNRHHIFPRSLLRKAGYELSKNLETKRMVNEIANRVTLTKAGNMSIFDNAPEQYLREVEERNPGTLRKFMIPESSELHKVASFHAFLKARRALIAESIMDFMGLLQSPADDLPDLDIETLLKAESGTLEFKSTLRYNLKAKRIDPEIERSVLKTICAYMNTDGGLLVVGVADDKEILGLEADYRHAGLNDRDRWELHLSNLVKGQVGTPFMNYMDVNFVNKDGSEVAIIRVDKATEPAYLRKGGRTAFFVRTGNSTSELGVDEIQQWLQHHFAA